MAPRKRNAAGAEREAVAAKTETTTTSSMRVTRSAALRVGGLNSPASESPAKKARVTKKKAKKEEDVKPEVQTGDDDLEKTEDVSEVEKTAGSESKTRTVVIEHCKQCNSFKTKANLVKDELEKALPDATVLLNPEKPRRGCFEVREEDGETTYISFLDLKRPFKPMKDINVEELVSNIVNGSK
ncbi:hypothetical protein Ddye_004903 [Dipteronia dyeriana]|uniref:Selenoprotein H n=1 Tax=Dipteronia dyeriana TaxID=168575 RepID=A0AAD9XFI0_9ROSI|nr:hypothetical protein Ddye_004903 [Dipteronia dyeriana]